MRIAATADLHFSPQSYAKLKDQFERVRDEADVLVLAGDLTNYGRPDEMEPLLNVLLRLRIPAIAVLGNHDCESSKEDELCRMMVAAGIKVLDGTAYERDGVGFAGTKGFVGGIRGLLCCTTRRLSIPWKARRAKYTRLWAHRVWAKWWIGTGPIWWCMAMLITEKWMDARPPASRFITSRSRACKSSNRRPCIESSNCEWGWRAGCVNALS